MSFMNIFKKKQTDEEFLAELGLIDPPKADPAAAAVGPQQGSSQFPGIAAMGAQVTMSSPSSLSASQIAQALQGLTLGLSKEEQEELKNLRAEYAVATKLAKLTIFKKLAAPIRQQVVDAYEWKITFDAMNGASAVKDQKLIDLERKEEMHSMFSHSHTGYKRQTVAADPSAYYPGFLFGIATGLPQGVTLEDLKQAHMEASLEEEMLGNGQS